MGMIYYSKMFKHFFENIKKEVKNNNSFELDLGIRQLWLAFQISKLKKFKR